MDREFFKKALRGLWFLTALDLVLWIFATQKAVFFTTFVLIPLWAIWVWFNPEYGNREEKG